MLCSSKRNKKQINTENGGNFFLKAHYFSVNPIITHNYYKLEIGTTGKGCFSVLSKILQQQLSVNPGTSPARQRSACAKEPIAMQLHHFPQNYPQLGDGRDNKHME